MKLKSLFLIPLILMILCGFSYAQDPDQVALLAVITPSYTVAGGTPPTMTSFTINTAGTTATAVFSEASSNGTGGSGGWALTVKPACSVTYASGSGSTNLVYNLGRTVVGIETLTISYTQPTNGVEATDDGVDVATITNAAVTNSSTVAYLLAESFNPTGYDKTWAETGTPNEDYATSPAPLVAGGQSLLTDGTSATQTSCTVDFTGAQNEIYFFGIVNFVTLPSDASLRIFASFRTTNCAGASQMTLRTLNTGELILYNGDGTHGGTTASAMSAGTSYCVWAHYKNDGTGDAAFIAYNDADGTCTKPTTGNNFTSYTGGTYTSSISALNLGVGTGGTPKVIFDNIRLNTTSIGSSPP